MKIKNNANEVWYLYPIYRYGELAAYIKLPECGSKGFKRLSKYFGIPSYQNIMVEFFLQLLYELNLKCNDQNWLTERLKRITSEMDFLRWLNIKKHLDSNDKKFLKYYRDTLLMLIYDKEMRPYVK